MSAIRLARGFTGRDVVVKFAGCYHGHVDSLLAEAGSGLATARRPGHARACRPPRPRRPWCCPSTTARPSRRCSPSAAARSPAWSPRPRPATWAWSRPEPGFNEFLAETCRAHGALFVSDEVMTGFRVSRQRPVGPRRRRRGLGARPDDLRQGDGRRLPGRGLRWPRRRDGDALARGAGLPGRHAVGEPGRDHRRAGHAAAGDRRGLRPHRRRRDHAVDRRRRGADRGRRTPRRAAPAATCSASSSASTADRARLRRGLGPGHRRLPGVLPRHARPGVYLPPSAFEAWFLSAAHDDRALQHVLDALPAAAAAAAAHRDPRWEPPREDHRPPAAPRRGAQPAGHPLRPRPGYHLSERGRAMAERVAERIGDRDITHIVSSPLERAQETAAPLAAVRGLTVQLDDRVIESEQHLRGQAVRPAATRSCGSRRSGRRCGTRSGPPGASPTSTVVARMWPAVLDAREAAAGPRGRGRLPPAADLDHPAQGRGAQLPARPAQAPLHAVQPDLVHLRGRAAGQRRLLRARRRPDPARRQHKPFSSGGAEPTAEPPPEVRARIRCRRSTVLPRWPPSLAACGGSPGTGDKGFVDGYGHRHAAPRRRAQEAGRGQPARPWRASRSP